MFSQRDPITVFDQRPSHPVQPDWLIARKQAALAAWAEYNTAIDSHADPVTLKRLRRLAVEADEYSSAGWRAWDEWLYTDHADDCTCNPCGGDACPACTNRVCNDPDEIHF